MRIRVFVQKRRFMERVHLHGRIDHRARYRYAFISFEYEHNASSAKWNVAIIISWAAKRVIRHLEFMWIIRTQSTLIGIMFQCWLDSADNDRDLFCQTEIFLLPFMCSIMKHKPPVARAVEKCVLCFISFERTNHRKKGGEKKKRREEKKNDDVKLVKMNDVGPFAHHKMAGPKLKDPTDDRRRKWK